MTTFKSLGLSDEILQAIEKLGFETPTPIQEKTIPILLENENDLIGLAQTGTGKTAAFGLPIIQKITESKDTQALILSPTRELCMQITNDLKSYAKNSDKINIVAVYGGASIVGQVAELHRGAQIVVGTPGRSLDLINRKKLLVNNIRFLVLDEADEMLTMGFKDELDGILETTPKEKQTLLFSATMPQDIVRISKTYMNKPIEVSVGKRNEGADNIEHIYYEVHAKDRYEALKRIADMNPKIYGIVFCRTRRETQEIAEKLMQDGYNADALHGDLSQAQRDHVMARFRSRHLQLLVATDVAARGLDVNDLTHIINFNLPDEDEVYIHRSGRTGRAGKSGVSLSILHMREKSKLRAIEKKIGKKFEKRQVPSGREICETQLFNLIDKFEQVEVNEKQIEPFLDVIYQKLSSLDREELIKRFVSVEFNQFLEYYKNARDLNAVDRNEPYDRDRNNKSFERGDRDRDRDRGRGRDRDRVRDREDNGRSYSERSSRSEESSDRRKSYADIEFSRFFINKGSKDDLNPVALIGLINKYSKERGIEIGKIEIMKSFSFFEIDRNFEGKLMNNFQDAVFDNSPVMLEVANSKGGGFREEGEIKRKKKSLAGKRSDSFRPAAKSKRSDSAKPYDKGKRRSRKP
ncbi:MAG: DEAD/DEAH box helicase [Bacteroidetes bacterium HGW-Bacteroidetes-16]|jgi:ATP-dependent RNA helicase DeaD|nr:MAG: DEAD/DEAH box helicase [Bacteroidetes bacterium HGW-Bacteroidetes-16]